MDTFQTLLVVATGVVGLLATISTLPLSPARFWSWRLRKHMETVKALDPERHAAQYAVLVRRADELASEAAAAHHIRTPWSRFVMTLTVS
jgi:DNA-binding GntR family transcriptional regulator